MTGITLPRFGVGTAMIGNLYAPVSDADAEAAIRAAVDGGITYFDTAPFYGFGLAERRLGAVLGNVPVRISTKVGRLLEPTDARGERHGYVDADPFEPRFDYSADAVRRSHESSLARLRRDRVDILLAHDLGHETHGGEHPRHLRAFLDGGYRAMRDLRDAGAIDAIGIGVNEIAVCLEVIERVELDVILLAGRYTLLDRSAADRLLPACERRGIRIIAGGPYNSGILAQDDLGQAEQLHYNYARAPEEMVARARRLAALCARFGVPLPAAALQFPLRDKRVATVIAGVANAKEVRDLIARTAADIGEDVWTALREEESVG
ncbi:MAG TPA: aldo/keto reductase [Sphingomonas sp.]|uniref:aldo/keto reductase n=1 Tax=Sphingomonas sp. TaxID=28214 RepID=UPI002CFD0B7E|nr:aldo/keto reductase [Sphingomonas sp.]HMI18852.1 aldo/keto reductase [Sphingomonas sp.]